MGKISFVIMTFGIFIGALASAAPHDIGCSGYQDGREVSLRLGFDSPGRRTPSLMEVTHNGIVVFSSTDVTESTVNVGTEDDPGQHTVWSASDEESNALVRVPDQSALPTRLFHAFLTVETDSGLFRSSELPMLCDR